MRITTLAHQVIATVALEQANMVVGHCLHVLVAVISPNRSVPEREREIKRGARTWVEELAARAGDRGGGSNERSQRRGRCEKAGDAHGVLLGG